MERRREIGALLDLLDANGYEMVEGISQLAHELDSLSNKRASEWRSTFREMVNTYGLHDQKSTRIPRIPYL